MDIYTRIGINVHFYYFLHIIIVVTIKGTVLLMAFNAYVLIINYLYKMLCFVFFAVITSGIPVLGDARVLKYMIYLIYKQLFLSIIL